MIVFYVPLDVAECINCRMALRSEVDLAHVPNLSLALVSCLEPCKNIPP